MHNKYNLEYMFIIRNHLEKIALFLETMIIKIINNISACNKYCNEGYCNKC